MTPDEYNQLLASASKSTQQLNASLALGDTRSPAKLERDSSDAPLATRKVQKTTRSRFYVGVTAHRSRLLDQDNLCEKYHVDLCRYAGALPADSPDQTQIEVSQQKVKKGEPEKVVVEVWKIS